MEAITLHYSEPIVRRAARAFWWRATGWTYVGAVVLLISSFAYLVWTGDRSWWVGVMGAVLGLGVMMAVALYVTRYRASIGRLRRMRKPEATLELGEERFRISSDLGASEVPWSSVTEVSAGPEFLLLFVSGSQYTMLPTADLGTTARDFILSRAASHGAKVA